MQQRAYGEITTEYDVPNHNLLMLSYVKISSANECLTFAGLDSSKYKTHSLHIGTATSAVLAGATSLQLQQMGRWHTDAYKSILEYSH